MVKAPKAKATGPYICDICNKTFSRSDVVTRHRNNVHLSRKPPTGYPSRRKSCSYCVFSKLKCSGGVPCDNCKKRGVDCEPGPAAHNSGSSSSVSPRPSNSYRDREPLSASSEIRGNSWPYMLPMDPSRPLGGPGASDQVVPGRGIPLNLLPPTPENPLYFSDDYNSYYSSQSSQQRGPSFTSGGPWGTHDPTIDVDVPVHDPSLSLVSPSSVHNFAGASSSSSSSTVNTASTSSETSTPATSGYTSTPYPYDIHNLYQIPQAQDYRTRIMGPIPPSYGYAQYPAVHPTSMDDPQIYAAGHYSQAYYQVPQYGARSSPYQATKTTAQQQHQHQHELAMLSYRDSLESPATRAPSLADSQRISRPVTQPQSSSSTLAQPSHLSHLPPSSHPLHAFHPSHPSQPESQSTIRTQDSELPSGPDISAEGQHPSHDRSPSNNSTTFKYSAAPSRSVSNSSPSNPEHLSFLTAAPHVELQAFLDKNANINVDASESEGLALLG